MADGDLISRASLLAAVAELKESPWYNFGKVDGTSPEGVAAMWYYGYLQRKEAVEIIEDMCIKKEPAVLADSGWISVKDRLPDGDGNVYEDGLEESKYVLVYGCYEDDYGYGIGTYIRDHINCDAGWSGCLSGLYELDCCNVTHWQPLPEPPKGE